VKVDGSSHYDTVIIVGFIWLIAKEQKFQKPALIFVYLMDALVQKFNDIRAAKFEELAEHEISIKQFLSDFYEE
jgi:uncharacterized protein (UPF0305 family)